MNVLTFILAGGKADALGPITEKRAKSALPFLGKYRVIDFTLSNCVNSGLYNDIGILTQYNPSSLIEHIGNGKPWDLDRSGGGIKIYPPYVKRHKTNWYRGTFDAVRQNRNVIEESKASDVLILSGDHIYKMNYRYLINMHQETDADITLAIMPYLAENKKNLGFVNISESGKITEFVEKPGDNINTKTNYVFMGIYLFKRDVLIDILNETDENKHDLVYDVVIPNVESERHEVSGYFYYSYWRDIGSYENYYQANMDMIKPIPDLNMYDETWKIHTRSTDSAPVYMGDGGYVVNSAVSDGARIFGTVNHSVLSSGVIVNDNSKIIDSVVMNKTEIGKNSEIAYAIIDKNVKIGEGVKILGTKENLVIIGKGAEISSGKTIEAGSKIEPLERV